MKKLLIPMLLLFGFCSALLAQEKSAKELRGDEYYFVYSFDKAIPEYSTDDNLTTEGQRRLSESYMNMHQRDLAESAYAKLLTYKTGVIAEDYFSYAGVLKENGKYKEAFAAMDQFTYLKPDDLRSKDYVANRSTLSTLIADNGNFKIVHLNINTDAIDFGPAYYKDKIVFASSRSAKVAPKTSNRTGQPYLTLYEATVDKDQLANAEYFDKSLNGNMNEGPASFSQNSTFMAFTQNNYELKRVDLIVKLEIYFRTFADDKWSDPVPFYLNNKAYSVGHPALSADGNTMYFASDMPGGYGGVDLYKVSRGNGAWTNLENLGPNVNTEANEIFPFYEEKSKQLYFASNGRFGLGGLDIFVSKMEGGRFGVSTNSGAPLNTRFDDFSVILDKDATKGYFASDRSGGDGRDDLYTVELSPKIAALKQITGIAMDNVSNPLKNTKVLLMDNLGNSLDSVLTNADGVFTFSAITNKSFKLTGNKMNYLEAKATANTYSNDAVVHVNLVLLQITDDVIVKKINVGEDLGKAMELKNIYFDYDKFNIRADAEVELNRIVKVINDYPTMVIRLGSYTDCRASKAYNVRLANDRANSTANYIKKRITNPERIYGKGYGEEHSVNGCNCEGTVVSNCSEEEFQLNRRTEFVVMKK